VLDLFFPKDFSVDVPFSLLRLSFQSRDAPGLHVTDNTESQTPVPFPFSLSSGRFFDGALYRDPPQVPAPSF